MKWFFLVSEPIFFKEFFWKVAQRAIQEGDECLLVIDSKIAEYGKMYSDIPKQVKILSKVDWCIKYYDHTKKNFGDLSWKTLFPDFDRYKTTDFNYKNSVEMISQLYQFVDFIFQKEKPDVVISGGPSVLFEQIVYYFSQKNKIPHLGLVGSRLGEDRIDICDLEHTDSRYQTTFNQLQDKDITEEEKEFSRNYLDAFLSHKEINHFMKEDQKIYFTRFEFFRYYIHKLKRFSKRKGIFFKYISNKKQFKDFDYRSGIQFRHFIHTPWRDIRRKVNIIFQKSIFRFFNENDKFFLYPLHFQPEYSTSVLATYYADQATTISNIAFSLPFPYKLYVKEHPSAIGIKPSDFYQKLSRIPNVVLISAFEKVPKLIERSAGVITLNSTVGMEAALAGKPAYVLGKVFYMYHPLCRKIENFNELKEKLQIDIAQKPDTANLESINLRFITSYLRNTIEGSIFYVASNHNANDYNTIYRELKKVIMRHG
ncbi:hypothetical protein ACFL06_01240 [Patescibacteria group bacterium]